MISGDTLAATRKFPYVEALNKLIADVNFDYSELMLPICLAAQFGHDWGELGRQTMQHGGM